MVTAKDLESLVTNFMRNNYGIAPSRGSLEIIARAGFQVIEDKEEQFLNLRDVNATIGESTDEDSLIARVFSRAYLYDYVLTKGTGTVKKWSKHLGTAEYELGRIKGVSREKIFDRAIKHLRTSWQRGNKSKENASMIGDCYFRLRQYEEALDYFRRSEERGNYSKENASRSGECRFKLGQFEKGIAEYEIAMERAKKEAFNSNWMGIFDHALAFSYRILQVHKGHIPSDVYTDLLRRFKDVYKDFAQFWKAHNRGYVGFKLPQLVGAEPHPYTPKVVIARAT